ncbi:hypothetical protein [Geobacter pickeringii]|uniref:Uncharacterized protein n=1 Tax=Geobacter pickeringii TaxID=345632 RepID=A0A0B5BF30_9BACT|nr:hypothetical protein [Geobacter pickeringii]AJE03754.1 hypothetical protein GPICK_10675 [Geobacter pickeringii]
MSESYSPAMELEGELVVNKDDFAIVSVDDEIRADGLCRKLLSRFYFSLLEAGMTPEEATALANGADYYVRDFVVGYKHRSLFDERRGIVRQFAGNWYIVNTIEPAVEELAGHLAGTRAFYRFLAERGDISPGFDAVIAGECDDLAYYAGRIRSFWEIEGGGYGEWERECTLKDR